MKFTYLNTLKALLLFFVFILFLYNSFNYLDPDFGWHLKAGEEIYQAKCVPWQENYNYTLEGKNWVDHEWLLNLISYLIYTKFGYFILNIIFAFIAFLVFFLLNFYLIKKYIRDYLHFLLIISIELIAIIGILPHSGVRMQEFSVLMFLVELILLDKFYETSKQKTLFFLPLLFLIWANLHGGFMIGLFVLWLFWIINIIAPKIINKFKINYFEYKANTNKVLLLVAILSSLSVFITPYHYKYFSFMLSYTNTYYMKHISEWLPAYLPPIIYSQQLYFIIFSLIIIFLFLNKKQSKINLWYLVLGFVLFVSALKSRRNFPLFFIASIPLITIATSNFNKENFKAFYALLFSKYLKMNLVFVLLLSMAMFLLSTNFTNTPFQNEKFCSAYPCEGLKSIKNLPQENLKIFNDYGSGGFLVWNWPNQKIFIDGRLPMLIVNNHSLLEEYYDFFDKEQISDNIKMHDINLVQGKKYKTNNYNWFEKTFLGMKNKKEKINPLEEYLLNSSEWKKIFEDENFFIYYKA
ncbi:MAG: hypothetical protein US83_C0010G0037 [Candidatus Falkowbacteria bacterium GW2011_GWC2_38_22]|uniref:Glycosyltransferase RgtA/B/C/D-like domain-containing protein n=1 Tax=Candidatus Falkowbacteria bacterium GW2011_GWE1_38_31 TaxID=1618638 RepID=A0A0G0JU89_9BACT|nr:MAG: hypothetical protein US73_C0005G0037 [Candidatus Falkowbacteria bacterium GW2011_GWF2_38_1205]KKQ61003.1 MAG: hypothetical protein US83_C0010G0037 [Candidatus Falkowbacteria bacterium GW2011_GWC2_38_22]KKQ63468.1 MAG: hypothetical protein US84_C0006G0071 [Candidatus Falkowbacteria bacterium GW2011_GWF1_38_22]KKQ65461.1 MAG: hypothetical protein US87_C0007G0037 [Candidatus Falkowbacteria bacterium GW2011_GWE2_38_254]KKQ70232.1 MAG: hypothetical protein US91_C0006G0071 [Candidatus Falkowb